MSEPSSRDNGVRQINAPGLAPGRGYSHAVSVDLPGRLVVLSGQIALDGEGNLVGPGDLEAQTRQVFANLEAALTAAGARWEHVVRLGYFLRDASGAGVVRAVRTAMLPEGVDPAASLIQVSGLVRDDLLIEVEALAVVPAPVHAGRIRRAGPDGQTFTPKSAAIPASPDA